jgi:hypothetical protein
MVFSTNKTDCHDIAEILLKVALNTITQLSLCIDYVDFEIYRSLVIDHSCQHCCCLPKLLVHSVLCYCVWILILRLSGARTHNSSGDRCWFAYVVINPPTIRSWPWRLLLPKKYAKKSTIKREFCNSICHGKRLKLDGRIKLDCHNSLCSNWMNNKPSNNTALSEQLQNLIEKSWKQRPCICVLEVSGCVYVC